MKWGYYTGAFETLKEARKYVDESKGEKIYRVIYSVFPGELVHDGLGPVIAPTEEGYYGTYDLYLIEQQDGSGRFLWVRHTEKWMTYYSKGAKGACYGKK